MSENRIHLPYGETSFTVETAASNLLDVIYPLKPESSSFSETEIISQALEHPVGTPRLRDMARKGQRVAIITSDLTRPCPSSLLLPLVLEELAAASVEDRDIIIVLGLGIHRPMSATEIENTVSPQVFRRFQTVNHDASRTAYLGATSRGTPVEIFKPVVEADLRICLGVIEFHWYAGYSGGAKAVLPGCASPRTILANHELMIQPGAQAGRLQDNPLRLDLEEGVAMLGVDFILNVVVENHRVIKAVAGEVTAAHRQGCEFNDRRGKIRLSQLADIVLASAGGYPKDINLFQAHKGMEHASYALRDGGILILVAECREGMGNAVFERWMEEAASPIAVLERMHAGFEFGGHKAAAIASILQRARVFLVSGFPDEAVKKMFMTPYRDPQAALQGALDELGSHSRVAVFPYAGSVVPEIVSQVG